VYSDDSDRPIRGEMATDSGRLWPPIPNEAGHVFRMKPAISKKEAYVQQLGHSGLLLKAILDHAR